MMTNEFIEHEEPVATAGVVHPGKVLKLEVLPALRISGQSLATAIGATRPSITKLLNGGMACTPMMALKIERAIGYSADLLVAMQAQYDLATARRDQAEVLARIEPIAA